MRNGRAIGIQTDGSAPGEPAGSTSRRDPCPMGMGRTDRLDHSHVDGSRTGSERRKVALAKCLPCQARALQSGRRPRRGRSILDEVIPSTGEPCAGDPPARFGGRGARTQSGLPTPITTSRRRAQRGSPEALRPSAFTAAVQAQRREAWVNRHQSPRPLCTTNAVQKRRRGPSPSSVARRHDRSSGA